MTALQPNYVRAHQPKGIGGAPPPPPPCPSPSPSALLRGWTLCIGLSSEGLLCVRSPKMQPCKLARCCLRRRDRPAPPPRGGGGGEAVILEALHLVCSSLLRNQTAGVTETVEHTPKDAGTKLERRDAAVASRSSSVASPSRSCCVIMALHMCTWGLIHTACASGILLFRYSSKAFGCRD